MPPSVNATEAREETDFSATAKASARRRRFRRWLWRKLPLLIVFTLSLLLAVVVLWHRVVIVIEGGHAGVLFRLWSGTEIGYVYPEGVHLINPFNTMHIYETREQVALHDFDVLTVKGLALHLFLAIRYQPELELLGLLHQRIGPDYLQRVIIPQIESVMRKELGNYTAEDIYTNKEGLLTKTILLALDEVGRNFVHVEDIIIRSIELPAKIKDAIEDKLTQEELLKSYEFRVQTASREAERLRIEGEGIKQYHQILAKGLTEGILKHQGIQATRELARSDNAKIIVIGSGKDGLPLILNTP
ncbi:SPFH domain, Band 7 family protein [Methylocaldum marinum]|uniref:SPFH domain, Band 7 family protein n=1 Tax=Methylocaldum marinum TaxID=1432792 RepID=A0A250KQJ7_9GAMM|nr:prohibitin family protein [Methylocaldum marinum]BBA33888.1 SPFH domain, Band 7 family protein [Methylocaldum marinum]